MARAVNPTHIDLKCIAIDVKQGLPNNQNNPRCEDNNETGDGFVYTCSTSRDKTGYQYDYNTNTNVTTIRLQSADSTDPYNAFKDLSHIRGEGHTNEATSESMINAKSVWKNVRQFDGQVTDSGNFIYNEGNEIIDAGSPHLNNATFNEKEGYFESNFFDAHAEVYSDILTKVRNLTENDK